MSGSLVARVQAGGPHAPLFFIHGVAGDPAKFDNLVRHMGLDETIYVLAKQNLDANEPLLTSVEAMAAQYIGEVRTVQPTGPYFIVGYSFGGLICFEMAQQLHRLGHKTGLVALIDTGQPIFRKDWSNIFLSPKTLAKYFRRFGELLRQPGSRATLKSRIRNELWRLVVLKLRNRGRTMQAEARPVPRTEAMVAAATLEAAVNYKPVFFPGRLSVYRVQERTSVDRFDQYLGWRGLAETIDLYEVPGDHVTVAEEPHIRVLAQKLKAAVQAGRTNLAVTYQ